MATAQLKRRLSAILSADVEGYSRLMRDDEEATVHTLTAYRTAITHLINQYRGRVVDSPGDNLLAEFTSVVDAVNCGVEIQRELSERNEELPENRRMRFRIGINLGDVLEEGERIYGDGVNIAARMESLAEAGGICISGTVYDAIENKIGLEYEYLGEHEVKNIDKPIRAYKVLSYPGAAAHRVIKAKRAVGKTWRNSMILLTFIVIVALAAGIWHLYFRPPPVEPASMDKMAFPLPNKPSIAVLPFVNMSGDPKQEYFSDGMTEEIITALSKVPYLFVIARNSTFTYKGKSVKIAQVAEELGVRYVLEGSVRKAGDRVRVTAQLIDAIKGYHLWAERYEREEKDIFALQDEITMKILWALEVKLTEGEQASMRRKVTDNLEAYLKTLQAMEGYSRGNREGNLLARQRAEEAIALDPKYARPYRVLAASHVMDVLLGASKSPKSSLGRAEKLDQKAISLDESDPCDYEVLSFIYLMKRQHDRAIAEAKRAIALDPNGADAHDSLGNVLIYAGRPGEAIAPLEKAIRINPIAPARYFRNLGRAYRNTGRYEEAIEELRKAINHAPDSPIGHFELAATYSLAGRDEDARAEVSELLKINPRASIKVVERLPYKNQADRDRISGALRKAGLPDKPPLPLPDKPSIAVLPFINMSDDPEQEYFSDGITEEIITALSKIPKLFVIARTSSFKYKGKEVDVRTVGRELGVRNVLEGSVRRASNKVRITAQLVDTRTGNHLWAERYDRDLKDIFAVQDAITKKIIVALQIRLDPGEEAPIHARGTDSLEAYLKALEALWRVRQVTKENVFRAKQLAEEAIALDPNYAYGYSLLSSAYRTIVWLGLSKSPQESLRRAIDLGRKAINLDSSLAVAHARLAYTLAMARQYDKAIALGERAVSLEPQSAKVLYSHASVLMFAGRNEEAIPLFKEALRINPKPDNNLYRHFGNALANVGRYKEAIALQRKAIDQNPNDIFAYMVLASVSSMAGREAAARAAAKEVLRLNPNFSVARFRKVRFDKDPEVAKRWCDTLREAGLPE